MQEDKKNEEITDEESCKRTINEALNQYKCRIFTTLKAAGEMNGKQVFEQEIHIIKR